MKQYIKIFVAVVMLLVMPGPLTMAMRTDSNIELQADLHDPAPPQFPQNSTLSAGPTLDQAAFFTSGEFDWIERFPTDQPAPAMKQVMAYDSARGVTVLFGGLSEDETWEWDGANWTQRFPDNKPAPRTRHAMAYDSARGVTILFGGSSDDSTWEWDGTDWYLRTAANSPPRVRITPWPMTVRGA